MKPIIRKTSLILFPLIGLVFAFCTPELSFRISNNDPNLTYMGRVKTVQDSTMMTWPGSSVTMNFIGKGVRVQLKDETGGNYYYVIIDNDIKTKIRPDTAKKWYVLASHLANGKHTVQLFKLTDVVFGKTWFYGFYLDENGKILPPPPQPKRKIEFYGNSITSGRSVDDAKGDSGDGLYENNYLSYAAITSRHYKAAYHCISMSGIGVMVSWFPVVMPELYDRLDPDDSVQKWGFSGYTPDIVVVDLLQNDSWLVHMHDNKQFISRFGTTPPDKTFTINAYKKFVESIRAKYPHASIICSLGDMDATRKGAPWTGYIDAAVKLIKDPKIYTCFFPYINKEGHPKVREQKAMADSLIRFIDRRVSW